MDETKDASRVCEGCGADPGTAEDPYCEVCGRRLRDAAADRVEVVLDEDFAGVSDRGLRHRENQDRMGLRRGGAGALCVVCDGVSQSRSPQQAAATVVAACLERAGTLLEVGGDAGTVLREAVTLAVQRLQEDGSCRGDCPATTVVAAVVQGQELTVLWAGDSRAYWKPDGGALQQITADHTVGEAGGEVSHTLMRWIAADAGDFAEPEVVTLPLGGPGLLLLCSDGLWNYAVDTAAMEDVLRGFEAGDGSAEILARGLVQFALERGGEDNVSAIALRLRAAASE